MNANSTIRGLAVLATMMLFSGITMSESHADLRLNENERIVFLGDSITQSGAGPGGYVTLVAETLDRIHPELNIEVIGAGISGHKVPDCQARLQRDVLDRNPTLVVIYIGINDVWHSTQGRGTSAEDYDAGLRDLVDRIQKAGARVLLCTPTVIGEKTDGSNTLDPLLDEYCQISREVAASTEAEMLDLRTLFLEFLTVANPSQRENSVLTTDGVHLNGAGNQFVARCMLEAFGVSPEADPPRVLRHLVLFKFTDETRPEQVDEMVAAFAALRDSIDAIHEFEMGLENSPEGLAQGFTHCFLVTFRDEADRATYLPHPEHMKFVELIGPHIDDVLVVDYWTQAR